MKSLRELCKRLPQIEIIDVCTSNQLVIYPIIECIFIITTVLIQKQEIPVADLSHVTSSKYVSLLEEFMSSNR